MALFPVGPNAIGRPICKRKKCAKVFLVPHMESRPQPPRRRRRRQSLSTNLHKSVVDVTISTYIHNTNPNNLKNKAHKATRIKTPSRPQQPMAMFSRTSSLFSRGEFQISNNVVVGKHWG